MVLLALCRSGTIGGMSREGARERVADRCKLITHTGRREGRRKRDGRLSGERPLRFVSGVDGLVVQND